MKVTVNINESVCGLLMKVTLIICFRYIIRIQKTIDKRVYNGCFTVTP
jgi:hypothetical protein